MGMNYPGRIPGQIVLQALYFFSNQGDLVVNSMAGGGTVPDACLLMNRRCYAFYVKDVGRRDVVQRDALEVLQGLNRKANLIFLDPPYFRKRRLGYSKQRSFNLSLKECLDFTSLAERCAETLGPDGRVALLMSDYTEQEPSESILIHRYINRFEE